MGWRSQCPRQVQVTEIRLLRAGPLLLLGSSGSDCCGVTGTSVDADRRSTALARDNRSLCGRVPEWFLGANCKDAFWHGLACHQRITHFTQTANRSDIGTLVISEPRAWPASASLYSKHTNLEHSMLSYVPFLSNAGGVTMWT